MSHIEEILSIFASDSSAVKKEWEKGEFLCHEGFELPRMYLILSGRGRIFRELANGRSILYRIYVPGSIIGDIELFTGSEASCSVQFITPARTISVAMENVRTNRERYSELLFYLGRGLARKLHENSLSEAQNTAYPLEVRLARYFLTFTDPELSAGSLGQLAEWMGCSYRHLTRSLAGLHRQGALRKAGGRRASENTGGGFGWEAADRTILEVIAAPILDEENRILFEPGEPLEE